MGGVKRNKVNKQHPGFKTIASSIAHKVNPHTGKPYGLFHARKILASATLHSSNKAKKLNPRLRKVKT